MCLVILLAHATDAAPTNNNPTADSRSTVTFVANSDKTTLPGETRLRKRHSKRHSAFNKLTNGMEWVNPCGGFYDPSAESGRMKRRNSKQVFKKLKGTAGTEYRTLKGSTQYINISNIHMWSLHNKTYKFLPKLKSNSTIALERWYRNMQTYVGSFAYLHRIQHEWDTAKLQRLNNTAFELDVLLRSSRNMLCALETALNSTHLAHRFGRKRLPVVSREQMSKQLKLYTKKRIERNPKMLQEADPIDLKWVKYYYYNYLETMWKVLRKFTKRRGQIAIKEQHRDFNEVEKPHGSVALSKRQKSELNKQANRRPSSMRMRGQVTQTLRQPKVQR